MARCIGLLLCCGLLAGPAAAVSNREGEVEILGGVAFTHHFVPAGGTDWHYVEAGPPDGEPVVFVAGLPESWFSFHPQLVDLAPAYRVIGLDLFGQSVRPLGASFAPRDLAAALVAFADAIGLHHFNLVTHDWGSIVGHRVAGFHPDRVRRYARMELIVHLSDPSLSPQVFLFQNPALVQALLGNPGLFAFVPMIYANLTVQPLDPPLLARIVDEWNQPALPGMVNRLFVDSFQGATPEGLLAFLGENIEAAARMDMPVLLIQADADPSQPLCLFDGSPGPVPVCTGSQPTAVSQFSNAPFVALQVIPGSGHFTPLEQPEPVSAAIRRLLAVRPPATLRSVQAFFDAAVAEGHLVGAGPGRSGPGRLGALRARLEAARRLLEAGRAAAACGPLRSVWLRSDGASAPPDFVAGSAADDLARRLEDLRVGLGC